MNQLAHTFSALGDPVRFAIVERLLTDGELCAGDLNEGMGISAPAVSRHLKVLRNAGVLARRVDRQRRMYSVRPEVVQTISAWTLRHSQYWQESLDRLERALDEDDA